MKSPHNLKPHPCNYCKRSFHKRVDAENHMRVKHPRPDNERSVDELYERRAAAIHKIMEHG